MRQLRSAAFCLLKPTIIWIIDSVRVMNQIQTVTKGMRPIKYSEGKNDLSFYTYLKDCRYQVKAHFIWNENRPELVNDRNENKHHNVAKRMIEKVAKEMFSSVAENVRHMLNHVSSEKVKDFTTILPVPKFHSV